MSYASIIAAAELNWNGDADENGVGDPNDNTANGRDGTWTGTAAYGTAPYGSGKSFNLNGSSLVRRVYGSASGNRCLSFWFKTSVSSGEFVLLSFASNNTTRFEAKIVDGEFTTLRHNDSQTIAGNVADGNWHHVAIVANATDTRFYLDGTLVHTALLTGAFFSATELTIGNTHSIAPLGSSFTGEIYDVILEVGTAWSATDVGDLYAEGTAPSDTTPPTLIAAVIPADGLTITMVFDETIQNSTGFSLTAPSAVTLSNPVVDANTITYDLSRTIGYTESLVLDYAPGNVQDSAGNALASITDRLVTNQSLVGASLTGGGSNSGIRTGGQL